MTYNLHKNPQYTLIGNHITHTSNVSQLKIGDLVVKDGNTYRITSKKAVKRNYEYAIELYNE